MILVVVYVGAVAVLFLFVVMMLDINFVELRQGFMEYLPIGALIGVILVIELLFVLRRVDHRAGGGRHRCRGHAAAIGNSQYPTRWDRSCTPATSTCSRRRGVILLIAMIGAIVLTLRSREGVRRQRIGAQLARTRAEAVDVVQVNRGEGV